MSGHSHWATIKRAKDKADQEKGKVFAKVAKEILYAIQEGGSPDPGNNVYLRAALEKAKEYNVPKDNVQRLLERSREKSEQLSEIVYEAFGPGNVAMVIYCMTNNTNRTLSEIRSLCNRHNGKLATPNSAMFMFHKEGLLVLHNSMSEENVLLLAEEIGAIDMHQEEGKYHLYVDFEALGKSLKQLQQKNISSSSSIYYRPVAPVTVGREESDALKAMYESLLENEDIIDVFINATLQ